MQVRYFAAAAEAAGLNEETVDIATTISITDLVTRLGETHPGLAPVLAVSTLLVDGVRARDRAETIPGSAQVDVLPPFAGG